MAIGGMKMTKLAKILAAVVFFNLIGLALSGMLELPNRSNIVQSAWTLATVSFFMYPVVLLIFMFRLGQKQSQADKGDADPKAEKKKGGKMKKIAAKLKKIMVTLSQSDASELWAVVRLKTGALPARALPAPPGASAALKDDVAFCDEILGKVSRSFSAVIRQLPDELCLPVAVFYLVLRALDTVEDETDLSKFEPVAKQMASESKETSTVEPLEAQRSILKAFYELHREDAPQSIVGKLQAAVQGDVGKDDEARLLREYSRVERVFLALPAGQQAVINDICNKMGNGMAEYLGRDLGAGTEDIADYNRYCHIVAGLVGEGLTRQFYASGLESFTKEGTLGREVLDKGQGTLASDMGLFLQKTNIIRDYLEDLVDGRSFWPRSVWEKHAPTLGTFASPEHSKDAIACLDDLVVDALKLAPRCLAYMETLENEAVIAFCAVPQVMAIMTLAEIFRNHDVFTGVVKIRKPLAAKILLNSSDIGQVRDWFRTACSQFRTKLQKVSSTSDTHKAMSSALDAIDTAMMPRA
mmetsp:Transcript_148422/g.261967  ORF Transcript_148422/g.261967 Transcript_148422/m.261967 type:complete len:526 (-) Transcript_148422:6-1583(-)